MLQRLVLAACLSLGLFGDAAAQAYRPGYGPGFRPGFRFLVAAPILYDFAGNSYPALTVARASGGYVQNLAGAWSSIAADTLRRSDRGALIEEARTNQIRNSSAQGVVSGTPGTLPTNWNNTPVSGLSREIVGSGIEDGVEFIEVRFFGTASATTGQTLFFEPTTQIAALQGQTWTVSFFIKLVGGSLTNVTAHSLRITERSSGGGALVTAISSSFTPTSAALGGQRRVYSATLSNASTAFAQPAYAFTPAVGAVDFTIRIGWPQMEQAASVSSPIRTTSAAATRAADDVQTTVPPAYSSAFFTFDDSTTQTVGVSPGAYTIPKTFGKAIRSMELRQ